MLTATSAVDLENPSEKWDDLDTALATAILEISRGPVKREILMYQEEQLHKGQPLCGRPALWIFLRRYTIDKGQSVHVDLNSLLKIEFDGDLELFLDTFDHCLLNLHVPPTEELLHAILEPQLRRCKGLAPAFLAYDAADDSSAIRTSTWLYDAARRFVMLKRREEVRTGLLNNPKKALIVMAKEKSKAKEKAAAAATPSGAGNGQGDNKDKGGQGDRDKEGKLYCIKWKRFGTCRWEKRCKYSHACKPGKESPTNNKDKGDSKDKGASGSAAGGGQPPLCRLFKKDGQCKWGEKCRFRHENAPQKTMLAPACAAVSYDDPKTWVLDTGTGIDVGGKATEGVPLDNVTLPTLATAGGLSQPTAAKMVTLPELDEKAEVVIMKDSPNALTIGR